MHAPTHTYNKTTLSSKVQTNLAEFEYLFKTNFECSLSKHIVATVYVTLKKAYLANFHSILYSLIYDRLIVKFQYQLF